MPTRQDNFNRADSSTTLGTPSDAGSAWVATLGTWGIDANRAQRVSSVAQQEKAYLETGDLGNVEVSFTAAVNAGSTQYFGVIARYSDENNYLMMMITTTQVQIRKMASGVDSQLALIGSSNGPGVRWMFYLNGNSLRVFKDGAGYPNTPLLSTTDGFNSSATKVGLISISTNVAPRWEDFLAESIQQVGLSAGAESAYFPGGMQRQTWPRVITKW